MVVGLQLPMQSVPTTSKVLSSNPDHSGVYSIQHYVIKFVSDLRTVVSSTNKDDRHDITEILLKVALNIITHNPHFYIICDQLVSCNCYGNGRLQYATEVVYSSVCTLSIYVRCLTTSNNGYLHDMY